MALGNVHETSPLGYGESDIDALYEFLPFGGHQLSIFSMMCAQKVHELQITRVVVRQSTTVAQNVTHGVIQIPAFCWGIQILLAAFGVSVTVSRCVGLSFSVSTIRAFLLPGIDACDGIVDAVSCQLVGMLNFQTQSIDARCCGSFPSVRHGCGLIHRSFCCARDKIFATCRQILMDNRELILRVSPSLVNRSIAQTKLRYNSS